MKGKIGAFCQTGVKIAVFIVSYYTAASLAVAPATGLYAFAPSAAQYSADLWTGALLCIIAVLSESWRSWPRRGKARRR